MSIRPSPFSVATSLAILLFDWFVLAVNMATHVHEFAMSTVLGACAAALTVAFLEQRRGASSWQLIVRALVAGAVVAAPLPLLGTVVAAAFLIWSAVEHAQSQRTH